MNPFVAIALALITAVNVFVSWCMLNLPTTEYNNYKVYQDAVQRCTTDKSTEPKRGDI